MVGEPQRATSPEVRSLNCIASGYDLLYAAMEQTSQPPKQLRLTDEEYRALTKMSGALARRITKALGKKALYVSAHERTGDYVFTRIELIPERDPDTGELL